MKARQGSEARNSRKITVSEYKFSEKKDTKKKFKRKATISPHEGMHPK